MGKGSVTGQCGLTLAHTLLSDYICLVVLSEDVCQSERPYAQIFRPIPKDKKRRLIASFRTALKPYLLFSSEPHKIHHFSNTALRSPHVLMSPFYLLVDF